MIKITDAYDFKIVRGGVECTSNGERYFISKETILSLEYNLRVEEAKKSGDVVRCAMATKDCDLCYHQHWHYKTSNCSEEGCDCNPEAICKKEEV